MSEQQGWIKLHRKILDNPIFSSDKGFRVWLWCLLKANHEEKDVYISKEKIHLNPGEFIFGRATASEQLEMKESTIRNWMSILQKDSYLDIKPTNKFSLIKINKWVEYQGEGQQNGQQNKNKWKTNEKQMDTNKNVKNDNNKKNIILHSEQSSPAVNEMFKIFYEINPTINFGNKTIRKSAERLIARLGEDKALGSARAAVAIFGKQYAPTITTPSQLEIKLSELVAFYKKNETSNKPNVLVI